MSENAILLATYNGKAYLKELLESFLAQKHTDFKCYIHDDGSTDGTKEILEEIVTAHPDRFFLLSDCVTHMGAKENFFHLAETVEADCYFFADQDDVWLPDKMEFVLQRLEQAEKTCGADVPIAVFSDMYVTDENLMIRSDSFLKEIDRDADYHSYSEILIDNPAAGCTMAFNRACRDRAIAIKNKDRVLMHDVWFLMVAAVFGEVIAVKEPLVYYRQHEKNEMGSRTESSWQKVSRNLQDAQAKELSSKKEAFYKEKQDLAREILNLPDVPEKKREVLEQFVCLHDMGFLKKLLFLKKNKIRRKRHNLWFMLHI